MKLRTALAVMVAALLLPAVGVAASTTAQAGAVTARIGVLSPGEMLLRGQSIVSPDGAHRLVFQGDGNLVLYRGAESLWSSDTATEGADRLVMQHDGDLVMYRALPFGGSVAWRSSTGGSAGASLTVREQGGASIRLGGGPLLWSVAVPAPDVGLGGIKHIVYGRGEQLVWLINADASLEDHYPVSGKSNLPVPGRYEVFSKSINTQSIVSGIYMTHMVRFTRGPNGYGIGFHSIPVYRDGTPVQTEDQLGQFLSLGCIRQRNDKAEYLYGWAPVGTPVVVLA